MQNLKPQVSPTGLCKWNLPDSEMSLVWAGPGVGLMLCVDKPGGFMTRVDTRGCEGPFSTRKEAQEAVNEFIRRGEAA